MAAQAAQIVSGTVTLTTTTSATTVLPFPGGPPAGSLVIKKVIATNSSASGANVAIGSTYVNAGGTTITANHVSVPASNVTTTVQDFGEGIAAPPGATLTATSSASVTSVFVTVIAELVQAGG